MKLAAQIFFIAAVLSIGAAVGFAVVKERELPEHILQELRLAHPDENYKYALENFRENLAGYKKNLRTIQRSFDCLKKPNATLYAIYFKATTETDRPRLEEWLILEERALHAELSVATLEYARKATTYGAISLDCFSPGMGMEWRDSLWRSVRQIICLSCGTVVTYGDDHEAVWMPLTEEACKAWRKVYELYFPTTESN